MSVAKIQGVSWCLMLLGVCLGYILGLNVAAVEDDFKARWVGFLPPLIALVWVYLKLISGHDGPVSGEEREKRK